MRTFRLPTRFYIDHMERALPTPVDLTNAKNYVTIAVDDPALGELLSDAEHYAHPCGPDNCPPGIIQSAKATARAIRRALL